MVLAELAGRVALRLQHGREGHGLSRHAHVGARLADRGQAGADRQLAGDEVGAARRAARLGVVVGEQHALARQPVEVRRLAGHDAPVVGADVEPADVVAHDEQDVRFCRGLLRRRDMRVARAAGRARSGCRFRSSPFWSSRSAPITLPASTCAMAQGCCAGGRTRSLGAAPWIKSGEGPSLEMPCLLSRYDEPQRAWLRGEHGAHDRPEVRCRRRSGARVRGAPAARHSERRSAGPRTASQARSGFPQTDRNHSAEQRPRSRLRPGGCAE